MKRKRPAGNFGWGRNSVPFAVDAAATSAVPPAESCQLTSAAVAADAEKRKGLAKGPREVEEQRCGCHPVARRSPS